MYPSNSDAIDTVDIDNKNSQIHQTNPPPEITSKSEAASKSPCPVLLVIDDNSNSEDSSPVNPSVTLVKPMATPTTTTAQISSHQLSSLTASLANDTPEQQRRRNSSIAKLLGGQRLNNQQYEEIHQQLLDDQSAQSLNHNGENGIQRSRSSITRTLLMNTERNKSQSKVLSKPSNVPPTFTNDFEYLIRQEIDPEQTSSNTQRNGSAPNACHNLNSTHSNNGQSSRFKRKRTVPKLTASLVHPKTTSNIPPFSLNEPFELESNSSTETNCIPSLSRSHRDPTGHPPFPSPSQFSRPTANHFDRQLSSSYPYPKLNLNSSLFDQFNIHHHHPQQEQRSLGNQRSSSFSFTQYPPSIKFSLPTPILPLSTAASLEFDHENGTSNSHKSQFMLFRSDSHEVPRPRSFSNLSTPSDSTSDLSVPLKKRLLHAYKNEQAPTSPL